MKLYLRGEIWWVSHWDGQRQVRMSTGCRDKKEAEGKALLLAPVLTQSDDELRVATAAAIGAKLARDRKRKIAGLLRLDECWMRYPHGSARKRLKESTLEGAKQAWGCFVEFCRERGVLCVEDVGKGLAAGFLDSRRPRWRVVCYVYCRAMFERVALGENPFDGLRPEAPRAMHREPLTREQVGALLGEADRLAGQGNSARDAKEFAVFVRFLLYTGLRLGDAATLKTAQVDFGEGCIERLMAKTGRSVKFPLHPALEPLLPRQGEYVFPSMADLYMRGSALTRRIKRLFGMAEISGEPQQYCAHALRTTFASICAEAGVPLAVIQSWLGHGSSTVTRIYARVEDMRAKKAAMEKFPAL